jgi:serine/threonine-protein phosphatase 5
MNKMYGFEGEVLHKYDQNVMRLFSELFGALPLAAVIQVPCVPVVFFIFFNI